MSKTETLKSRRAEAVANGVATRGIYAVRAENAELWDADGKRYIDFAAGIAVNNTGHRHPKLMAAVAAQSEAFTHTCFHVAPYESYIALAERLNASTPGAFKKKTMMVTTGAEAVENAVKMARAYTGRSGVIAFSGGFHGRTLMGMALCGKVTPYKKAFGAMPPEVLHAPFPNEFHGVSVEQSLAILDNMFKSSIDPERVAAMIIEPVQGEGGFNIAQPEFLRALRKICDDYGIILIADEVQAGIARTGKLFAFEHAGVAADLVTMAKGLAGGFPLSAVTGRAEVVDAAPVGGIGGTYAGNPLAVAAANAVFDVIEEEKLCDRATDIGEKVKSRLNALAARQGMEAIGDVRGLGAMIAFELVTDRDTNAPDPALTQAIVAEAEARGLIILPCGTRANAVRLLPPLTIPMEQLDEAMDIIEASIEAAISKTAA
ncbi:4-aminobutyrate--2-oxoglutarate transaminase (plasmid) [Aliiroseovarius crassostreae]|uniref:4-aminobutyrate--2-oxoglutarate transaminase n=1 Tax=Aliiroseovarius crassostreae TaxID=154981 RepID=A0A9Q9LYP8_9RHOB|nr:4-aminobutyrate--2-oxoglutarate transaminase [Aliiroseovarius crassostreae]UWP91529.1 4-aminobutyrate--2-oxoglutarate transaminase [Aliiroseovarius crassostreae]UWP94006.1 4-aminobutyrate--2-oxoglutarate transaminase [Aliiroseovarius crassostreae]UWP94683.1 4-aminobutyrate--2-oxoglutarate transaminase [Aliiroseovarius crassostreae]UWP97154.1 4-aminobutyrate--2-oxoglutarate transaminase [Aliiroseovarius crassostreae]UWP97841.1 4-aminobutyrate--2-oxoglutarate transaminase [Aliiroseovarius cra